MSTVRQPLPPATGLARWVGTAINVLRLLEITPVHVDGMKGEPQTYEVDPVDGGYNLHCLTHAINTGEFKHYRIRHFISGSFTCSCADATSRPDRRMSCKHVRGLLAALKAQPF